MAPPCYLLDTPVGNLSSAVSDILLACKFCLRSGADLESVPYLHNGETLAHHLQHYVPTYFGQLDLTQTEVMFNPRTDGVWANFAPARGWGGGADNAHPPRDLPNYNIYGDHFEVSSLLRSPEVIKGQDITKFHIFRKCASISETILAQEAGKKNTIALKVFFRQHVRFELT